MKKKIYGGGLLCVYQNSTVIKRTLSYQACGRFLMSQCQCTVLGQQKTEGLPNLSLFSGNQSRWVSILCMFACNVVYLLLFF